MAWRGIVTSLMRGQQSRATITKAAVILACAVAGVCLPGTDSYRPKADIGFLQIQGRIKAYFPQRQLGYSPSGFQLKAATHCSITPEQMLSCSL